MTVKIEITFRCDARGCGKEQVEPGAFGRSYAKERARDLGWSCGLDRDLCPEHARESDTSGGSEDGGS